jgi:hypothetical protein
VVGLFRGDLLESLEARAVLVFSLVRGADLGVPLRAACDTATAALRRSAR